MFGETYLERLVRYQADLAAVDLSGAGSLTGPAEALRAAVQAGFDLLFAIDPNLTRWLAIREPGMLAEVASRVDVEIASRSSEFVNAANREAKRTDLTSTLTFREGMILVGEYTAQFRATGITLAGRVETTLAALDAAIAAFSGSPAELAAGRAARGVIASIAGSLGMTAWAGDPPAVPALAQLGWIGSSLGDRW